MAFMTRRGSTLYRVFKFARSLGNLFHLRFGKWRPPLIYDLVAPVVLALAMVFCADMPFIERLENLTLDMRFRVRSSEDPPADPRLLLIGIDQTSLERYGQWPWSRERHGDLC